MNRAIVLALILMLNQAVAQTGSTFSPNESLAQVSVFPWTGENGLISNNVTSSIQAKSGFIWITTYNGIMRFDGKRVDVYDRKNIPFLSTDAFYKVYEDTEGILWFASQGSGLIRYDGNTFSPIDSTGKVLPKSIRCLHFEEGTNKRLWIGSNNEGLFILENNIIQQLQSTFLNDISILDLDKDANNVLWIATDGNGVVSYDGKQFTQYTDKTGLLSNTINSIKVLPDKSILIGTDNGLNKLTDGHISTLGFIKNIPINDIVVQQNKIWIATENGLARISDTESEFLEEDNGLPFVRINSISFDNEGSTWLSTGRNGLVQLKFTGIINFTTAQGLSMDRINIVVETENRTFYIGSDGGDVDIYKDGKIENLPLRTNLSKAAIRDICKDTEGNLWIASYKGILKVTGKQEKLYTTKDGLPAVDMRRILLDKKGNLWFASRSGGVTKFKNGKILRTYLKGQGLTSNYILSMEEDSKGNIYVGTHSGGLTKIADDGTPTTYSISENDAGILIFNIHIDEKDSVWLVANSGIYYFNGSSFKRIELEGLNKGETFFDLVMDLQQDWWITSNIGVLKIKEEDVTSFLKNKATTVPFKLYDNQDGMKSKECTGATRSLLSASGRIWVPTIGGVSVFYPDKIIENKITPPTYVTSLVTDKQTYLNDNCVVPPGNLRYTFNFTALSYISPSKVKFKYKLDKVDADWVDSYSQRHAEYTNLKPGTYTFQVIACNNDGVWNTEGAAMHFTVKPFFYQTIWFYAIIFIVVSAILYGTYKLRVSQIEKRNAALHKLNSELDKFVYSTSHDLRAPLASILGLVNLSRLEEHNKDQYINLIEKSVKKLDEFINEIIDYSRNARLEPEASEIDFNKIIHSSFENLQYLEEKSALAKSISITSNSPFYSDKTRIEIIINNLLSNAIKYQNPVVSQPYVNVTVRHVNGEATISVEDNGIGISQENQSHIFKMFYRGSDRSKGSGLGLYIVKEAVDKLGGTIQVTSTLGVGSTFTVMLPSLKVKG